MKNLVLINLIYASLISIGCSTEDEPAQKTGVIPAHQLETLKKAEQTEELIKEAERKRQEQLQ